MHLTLKLDTAMPPCSSLRAQQRVFGPMPSSRKLARVLELSLRFRVSA